MAFSPGRIIAFAAIGAALIQCERGEEPNAARERDEGASRASSRLPAQEAIERKTLASGLVIEELVVGDGVECQSTAETVTIHYRGMLEDGREFDSSYSRAQPLVAPLEGLIRGWQQGVPGMRVGGRRRLTVPAELAYSGMAAVQPGETGARTSDSAVLIPPGATLVFEIELLDVKHSAHAMQ